MRAIESATESAAGFDDFAGMGMLSCSPLAVGVLHDRAQQAQGVCAGTRSSSEWRTTHWTRALPTVASRIPLGLFFLSNYLRSYGQDHSADEIGCMVILYRQSSMLADSGGKKRGGFSS